MLSVKIVSLLAALMLQGQVVDARQQFSNFLCDNPDYAHSYCSHRTHSNNGTLIAVEIQIPRKIKENLYICDDVQDPTIAILNECCQNYFKPPRGTNNLKLTPVPSPAYFAGLCSTSKKNDV
ncbi:hypothetical protein PGTUg99_000163 [Puccinia graminis f. sp. tritici]|uniref:SREBP regulating gene protein n=1 Tax=Puccinia graminis f. sp. tritici TaxID=56615 RepID=A0A5B0S8K5_PUCGR|nr:hypothetical protein PGTUg99_010290 [Puccinia graminis f. sp. tritici]KAA1134436.1 hypothetical protein PGTUg99_000163 [Puccinia graminis f. sp. tritici]